MPFDPGDQIEIREVLDGKIWTARPVTVVQDTDEALVTYLVPDTPIRYPEDVKKGQVVLDMWQSGRWELGTTRSWAPGILRITRPGQKFDVWAFRHPADGSLSHWYVNMGEPFRRASYGFDTMDEILDVIVEPDLSTWRWKDDWELDLAVELGVYDAPRAQAIREGALAVIRAIEAGTPPWDTRWAAWDPATLGLA